jgi:diaminopimelate epimerase
MSHSPDSLPGHFEDSKHAPIRNPMMMLERRKGAIIDSGGGPATLSGTPFFKMSGSGNDFVFLDNRSGQFDALMTPGIIDALCHRRTGIGADGVVLIDHDASNSFGMRYYNRDGTLAEMCGNAALCSARIATHLGIVPPGDFTFQTPSGPVTGRIVDDTPEIDMTPVTELAAVAPIAPVDGEQRIGYARVGVPHLVVQCRDVEDVDVDARGRSLRRHAALRDGANVNFVSRRSGGEWSMRTFERGVEAETLACGTGAVATVALLNAWGDAATGLALETRSGKSLYADVGRGPRPPILRGEGRIVFAGTISSLPVSMP